MHLKWPYQIFLIVNFQVSGQQHISSMVEGTLQPVWDEDFVFYVPINRRSVKGQMCYDVVGDMVLRTELWDDTHGLGGMSYAVTLHQSFMPYL